MAGKATVSAPSSSATFSAWEWQPASRCERSSDFAYTGPTVWMTQRAGRFPPAVATAWPVGSPSGYCSARIRLHSARMAGPPLRWIAPSTPPPPISEELAALTTASASCSVMSPRMSTTSGMPVTSCSIHGLRVPDHRHARVPPVGLGRHLQGFLDRRGRLEPDVVDHRRVFRPRHDHASGVAQALQRVQGHDPVRRVEPVRVSVALDVVLPLRERGLEPVPGLEG